MLVAPLRQVPCLKLLGTQALATVGLGMPSFALLNKEDLLVFLIVKGSSSSHFDSMLALRDLDL